jgi:hypothetical protein
VAFKFLAVSASWGTALARQYPQRFFCFFAQSAVPQEVESVGRGLAFDAVSTRGGFRLSSPADFWN